LTTLGSTPFLIQQWLLRRGIRANLHV